MTTTGQNDGKGLDCLVTGATGFVGGHVVRALQDLGCRVTALCRNVDKAERVAAARGWNRSMRLLRADIAAATPDQLRHMAGHRRILHLAWERLDDFKAPEHTKEVLPRHRAFLQALVAHGARHLLCVGTCLEYGLVSGPLSETLPPWPMTPYGQAKEMLRREVEALCRNHGAAFCWARLFYMYGPGQSEKALLAQLDRAIAEGAPVFKMSGGMQLRDYLPVTRVAAYLARLALLRGNVGTVNVASGQPVSVLDLVQGHLRTRGATMALQRGVYPYPDYEPMEFWADTALLRSLLCEAPLRLNGPKT